MPGLQDVLEKFTSQTEFQVLREVGGEKRGDAALQDVVEPLPCD